jgi:phage terminase small subunit
MPRGRPRKPVAQHIAEGSYREDRHGPASTRPLKPPRKPKGLRGKAAEFWDERVKELIVAGVAASTDTESLELLCRTWAALCECQPDPEDKDVMVSWKTLFSAWCQLASRFGLTPSDRAKIFSGRPGEDPDKEFFG